VVNGENATAGIGVSDEDARAILAAGADAITGGNHSFEKRDFWPVLADNPAVLRPMNFPEAQDAAPPSSRRRASGSPS
jgi:calcineurin-like phosphoesterase